MFKKKLVAYIAGLIFLTSCGGWSDKSKAEYLKICEKKDLSNEFCECALEKATANYSDFQSAMNDEIGHGEILINCINTEETPD